jgi:hypothetical protein
MTKSLCNSNSIPWIQILEIQIGNIHLSMDFLVSVISISSNMDMKVEELDRKQN